MWRGCALAKQRSVKMVWRLLIILLCSDTLLAQSQCTRVQTLEYGDTLEISLPPDSSAVQLHFSPAIPAQRRPRSQLLMNCSQVTDPKYQPRLSALETGLELLRLTTDDQGAYTVWDEEKGKLLEKICLTVKGHQSFLDLAHGDTLHIPLFANESTIRLLFGSRHEVASRVLVDRGEVTDEAYRGRLSLLPRLCTLQSVTSADTGVYKVVDSNRNIIVTVTLYVQEYRTSGYFPVATVSILGVLFILALLLYCKKRIQRVPQKAVAMVSFAKQSVKEMENDRYSTLEDDDSVSLIEERQDVGKSRQKTGEDRLERPTVSDESCGHAIHSQTDAQPAAEASPQERS
ncbi:uncharacterized protein LOC136771405 [Amia ocellicauda]|uniref:uncharacterized protein LOC136771405 n=1 Tax=Amia ocellicauda TaxID=2972642 RepID=UPI003463C0F3